MKKFVKLFAIYLASLSIFSCSGGGSGAPVEITPAAPVLPDARTIPSVKNLKMNTKNILCGSNFSSELSDNQMLVNTSLNDDMSFVVTFTFYDSSCATSATLGNVIATYNLNGIYAVTTAAGDMVLTATDSKMTILAGDYPHATKKFVDWMNTCSNLEGQFSPNQNTTLFLSLGPKCDANVTRAFNFLANGESTASSEADLNRLVAKGQ